MSPETHSGLAQRSIDSLPNELVFEVFCAYDAAMAFDHDRHLSRKMDRCYRCHWAPLMLVCRRWRTLGISTPCLWQHIEVSDNLHWVELALVRSRSLAIRLMFTDRFPLAETLHFLTPHAGRIQALIYPIAFLPGRISRLEGLFKVALPTLHEIEVVDRSCTPMSPAYDLSVLGNVPLPALRTLRLSSIYIPLQSRMLSNLHCLCLDGDVFHIKRIDHVEFLNILGGCVELKELRLDRVLRHISEGTFPNRGIRLTFPHLRKLVVRDHTWITSSFLSNLQLSQNVTLQVCLPWQGGLSHALYTESLDSLLPSDRSGLPILRTITTATINCWHEFYVAIKAKNRDAKITLKISGSMRDPGTFYLSEAQEQFRDLFAGAPLEHIELTGDLDLVPDIQYHLRFFAQYPELRSLRLSGCGSPNQLLRALGQSPSYVPTTFARWLATFDSSTKSSEPLICPNLRSLTLEYSKWRRTTIDTLLVILRRRVEHGLPKLDELVLLARRESPSQEIHETQLWRVLGPHERALFETLQSYASEIKYALVDGLDLMAAAE